MRSTHLWVRSRARCSSGAGRIKGIGSPLLLLQSVTFASQLIDHYGVVVFAHLRLAAPKSARPGRELDSD
jgi:hypothetical protein